MFKYILIISLFTAYSIISAKTDISLSFKLESIYNQNVNKSKNENTPILSVTQLELNKDSNFNTSLFLDIQNVSNYFEKNAIKNIRTMDLYNLMEKYIDKNSLLSKDKKDSFNGCKARIHKIKDKSCVSSQELYVIFYSSEEKKDLLIKRYFNTYTLPADNSKFFSMDVYEKKDLDKNQCVYEQKQWGNSYILPNENKRHLRIDNEKLILNKPKTVWFCSNSYNPFGDNEQICNLLKMNISKIKLNNTDNTYAHFFSSFSIKENSCNVKINQKKVIEYSKKHKKITNANSESSYYSIIVEKNNHLLIYTNSAYCSSNPKIKKIYESNISNIQSYTCIGEDDSSYYSNYRLMGVDPEQRSELKNLDDED